LRVVVVSANAMTADGAKAKALGVLDYWEKPLKLEPFLAGVAKYLGLRETEADSCEMPGADLVATESARASFGSR